MSGAAPTDAEKFRNKRIAAIMAAWRRSVYKGFSNSAMRLLAEMALNAIEVESNPQSYAAAMALVDVPTVRVEGLTAFKAGISSYDCPYPYGSAIADVWWDGWFAARDGRNA